MSRCRKTQSQGVHNMHRLSVKESKSKADLMHEQGRVLDVTIGGRVTRHAASQVVGPALVALVLPATRL